MKYKYVLVFLPLRMPLPAQCRRGRMPPAPSFPLPLHTRAPACIAREIYAVATCPVVVRQARDVFVGWWGV